MPKVLYKPWKPGAEARAIVREANAICADYQAQGYSLTLRQLYYRFVSRDLIPNNLRSYKRLGDLVVKARYAGLLDWSYITDRTRNLESNSHWSGPASLLRGAARGYALDKWATQNVRVEVWVEKEALADIVGQAAEALDCAWLACRGYMSVSEMWTAAQRHLRYIATGQRVVIVHLGDHDPSGIDMTRDIKDRMHEFLTQDWLNGHMLLPPGQDTITLFDIHKNMREHLADHLPRNGDGEVDVAAIWQDAIEVNRIALNMDQVEQYDPPPNFAKATDSRYEDYQEQFGTDSWELDALDPAILNGLIQDAIRAEFDEDRYAVLEEQQEEQREILNKISARWEDVQELLATEPEEDS